MDVWDATGLRRGWAILAALHDFIQFQAGRVLFRKSPKEGSVPLLPRLLLFFLWQVTGPSPSCQPCPFSFWWPGRNHQRERRCIGVMSSQQLSSFLIRSFSVLKLKVENNWGHRQYTHLPRDGYRVLWRERTPSHHLPSSKLPSSSSTDGSQFLAMLWGGGAHCLPCKVLGVTTLFSGIQALVVTIFVSRSGHLISCGCYFTWLLFIVCYCYLARGFGICFIFVCARACVWLASQKTYYTLSFMEH